MADRLIKVPGVPNLWQRESNGAYVRRWKIKGQLKEETLKATSITDAKLEAQGGNVDPKKRRAVKRNVRAHDAWQEFIDYKTGVCDRCPESDRIDERTVKGYQSDWNNHIEPVFKNMRIAEITEEEIHAVAVSMRRKTHMKGGVVKHYSPRTIDLTQRVISTWLSTMAEPPFGYLPDNPALRMGYLKSSRSEIQKVGPDAVLSEPEIDKIANIAFEYGKHNGMVWKTLFLLAPETGMRMSELLGLIRGDLDFVNNEIHVERQLSKFFEADKPETWFKGLKGSKTDSTGKARIIPMSPFARQLLSEYIEWADKEGRTQIGMSPLFATLKRTPIGQRGLARAFTEILERAKLGRRVTFHYYRHTYASVMFANGASYDDVRRLLGHSTVAVTEAIYVHYADRRNFNARIAAAGRQIV
jgi:integrase